MVRTSLGAVEVALEGLSDGAVVVLFPGGHCTAACRVGADLYTDSGYRVLTFSRPGYGRTRVSFQAAARIRPADALTCDDRPEQQRSVRSRLPVASSPTGWARVSPF